jgi:YVTN family beta-propeller protein
LIIPRSTLDSTRTGKIRRLIIRASALVVLLPWLSMGRPVVMIQPPGHDDFTHLDPKGTSVLPSGRYLTPAGVLASITHDPFGLAISPDGKTAICLHHKAVTLIDTGHPEKALRFPSYDKSLPPIVADGSFMGVAFAPDGKKAYLAGGTAGTLIVFDVAQKRASERITLNGTFDGNTYEDSFAGDIVASQDGTHVFVLDIANYRIVTVDISARKVIASVRVGRLPFSLGLSPDESTAWVANVGIYEYPLVPGVTATNGSDAMLHYPPYGIPSKEAEEGTVFEGRKIPGLGSPNVPESMSVWAVDLKNSRVIGKYKTGYKIGQLVEGLRIIGGSCPDSIAVGNDFVYVSNATDDNIAIIDPGKQDVVGRIQLKVDPRIDQWRGLMPFGLALSKDGRRLYVALLTLNAIGVIDTQARKVIGYIPAGWCPTKVRLAPDDSKLYVVNARGYGAGPNGGKDFVEPEQGTYIRDVQLGTFQTINVPDESQLAGYTQQVINNTFQEVTVDDNGKNPLPPKAGLRKSPIKYVVYITKGRTARLTKFLANTKKPKETRAWRDLELTSRCAARTEKLSGTSMWRPIIRKLPGNGRCRTIFTATRTHPCTDTVG